MRFIYFYNAIAIRDLLGKIEKIRIKLILTMDKTPFFIVGQHAVVASKDKESGSIILRRQFSETYYCDVDVVELHKVAKHTKNMPEEYLEQNKPYVTNDFFEYAMPLTGGIEPKTQIFV